MDLTAEFAPIFLGLIALMLLCVGGILAGVDPELTEVYLGDPTRWLASIALAIVVVVTLVAVHPLLGYGLRALAPN